MEEEEGSETFKKLGNTSQVDDVSWVEKLMLLNMRRSTAYRTTSKMQQSKIYMVEFG